MTINFYPVRPINELNIEWASDDFFRAMEYHRRRIMKLSNNLIAIEGAYGSISKIPLDEVGSAVEALKEYCLDMIKLMDMYFRKFGYKTYEEEKEVSTEKKKKLEKKREEAISDLLYDLERSVHPLVDFSIPYDDFGGMEELGRDIKAAAETCSFFSKFLNETLN